MIFTSIFWVAQFKIIKKRGNKLKKKWQKVRYLRKKSILIKFNYIRADAQTRRLLITRHSLLILLRSALAVEGDFNNE